MSISKSLDRDPSRFLADCAYDDEDAEDVLSLCDMPLYGDAGDCSFSSSSVSSSSDEFFEFSPTTYDRRGNDRPCPTPARDSRDIIFCGKLIHCSGPVSASNIRVISRGDQTVKKNRKGVTKKGRTRGISYTSARSDKWYMMAFGLARFPSEMAMSEIKRRQGKGNCGAIVVSTEVDGRTKGKEGGGAWWMLKSLRCSRKEEEDEDEDEGAVVKTSLGCFPRL